MKSKVLIFTKRVLPRSNTFVAAQANNLSTFEPIFIGLRPDKTGEHLIEGKQRCIQAKIEPLPVLSRLLLDGFQFLTPQWANALAAQDAKLIHAHFGKGGYYCTPIANKLDLPLITTFHGSDVTQEDKFSYGAKHRNITFNQSVKVLAVSNFIQQKLLQRGCPEHKIIQHYIGIDTAFFSPSKQKSSMPTVLFVGRLIEQKGCQFLLQAMKLVQQKIPEAQLLVAGYGNYRDKLEQISAEIPNVFFLGAQDRQQVRDLMRGAWVTCLPSIVMARGNEEGMPTVCVESQAVGTPVIAFDTGGVKEGVIDGETGLLCREKNIDQLADNLLSVLQSQTLRHQMSEAAVRHVTANFDIKIQCGKLEQIYQNVCR